MADRFSCGGYHTSVYSIKTTVVDESKFKNPFLSNVSHQKSLLMKLCIDRLSQVGTCVGECACATTMERLSELCLSASRMQHLSQ